jgi:hypothetical protein
MAVLNVAPQLSQQNELWSNIFWYPPELHVRAFNGIAKVSFGLLFKNPSGALTKMSFSSIKAINTMS